MSKTGRRSSSSRLVQVVIGLTVIAAATSCTSEKAFEEQRLVHDAGPVFLEPGRQGQWRIAHSFAIRNPFPGSATVAVDGVSCGCSTVELADEIIAPRGETSVRLETHLRYKRQRSIEYANLRVVAPDGREQALRVTLACDVFPQVVTSLPQVPYEFDLSTPFVPTKAQVDFFFYAPADFQAEPALRFSSENGRLYLTHSKASRLALGDSVRGYKMSVTLWLDSMARDSMLTEISIHALFGPLAQLVPIRFRRQPLYWCEPPVVYLSQGRPAAEVLLFRASDSQPPLEPQDGGSPFSAAALAQEDELVQRFRIELPADRSVVPLKSTLSFRGVDGSVHACDVYAILMRAPP